MTSEKMIPRVLTTEILYQGPLMKNLVLPVILYITR